jgi:hypothetical protein
VKVNLFKLGKNKRFNYNPRYYKEKSINNIYAFDSAYSKNRNFTSSADISSRWKQARLNQRNRSNRSFSTTIGIIVLVLFLIFLFIIDFDLSIFLNEYN